MLLAIDTATRWASLALYDGTGVVAERSWRCGNSHTVQLLPACADMMAQQGLTPAALKAVAVARGPGSFTGLRIGMSIAKGLCLALDIPIIAIPTLDVSAYAAGDTGGRTLAVLEAGRGRVCVGSYHFEEGLPVQEGEIELALAAEWAPHVADAVLVTGEVSAELAERLLQLPDAERISVASYAVSLRRAGYLAELAWDRFQSGQVDDLDTLSPIYGHYAPSNAPHEPGPGHD